MSPPKQGSDLPLPGRVGLVAATQTRSRHRWVSPHAYGSPWARPGAVGPFGNRTSCFAGERAIFRATNPESPINAGIRRRLRECSRRASPGNAPEIERRSNHSANRVLSSLKAALNQAFEEEGNKEQHGAA